MSKWIEADRIKGVRNCHMYPFKSWGRYNPLLQCLYGQRKTVERVRISPVYDFKFWGRYKALKRCLHGQYKSESERVRNQPYVSFQILRKIYRSPTMSTWLEEDSREGKKLALCVISHFGEDTSPSNDKLVKRCLNGQQKSNSFILEHLGAAGFKIFFNHGESILIEV